ncbi:BON domain-containing protein [Thiohalorhabdus sp. Cl-TMA]|uniref:BON domain-containing protein n=1 Tax=Thiohalorhabdus methylotrophus TaxID=3242694 RepID=A0ABV4U163_9GAMM
MSGNRDLVKAVTAALEFDAGVNLHDATLEIRAEGATVYLTGEVADIAHKRRAPGIAARVEGVEEVEDHLRVRPDEPQTDGQIMEELRVALLEEPVFEHHTLRMIGQTGEEALLREPERAEGDILFSVEEGVVSLDGAVYSLSHRRMAALLAWWASGTRNVINGLVVTPAEEDNAGELSEAVELALERDVLLDGTLINVQARDGVVFLGGTVKSEREKTLAEHDAWYVEGTREVENRTAAP